MKCCSLKTVVGQEQRQTLYCAQFASSCPWFSFLSCFKFYFFLIFGCIAAYGSSQPGSESKLQVLPKPQLWKHQILLTHCAGPGIELTPQQKPKLTIVRFLTHWATAETPLFLILLFCYFLFSLSCYCLKKCLQFEILM